MIRLGDQEVEIKRLGTRNALRVGRQLLEYIKLVSEHWDALQEATQTQDTARRTQIGFEFVEILAKELDTDSLLEMLANLIGQPVEIVGDAPLEDTLDAVALAFEVNDMPALVTAGGKVVKAAGDLFNQVRGAPAAAPADINRAARRRATKAAKVEPAPTAAEGEVLASKCPEINCELTVDHEGEHFTNGQPWSELIRQVALTQPALGAEH
jgi:hypothetical protein